jgi:NAD(P)H-hydrate epimerase
MNRDPLTSLDMERLELNSEYLGISPQLLMENAGREVANEIDSRFKTNSKIIIFGGTGRNGGDGMVVARHLASLGYDVIFNLVGKEFNIKNKSTFLNWKSLKSMSLSIERRIYYDSSMLIPVKANVIVDALLGVGAKGNLRQPLLNGVKCINNSKGYKISIDIPSGIDADTGKILGDCVNSDLTITFHGVKRGLNKAKKNAGEIKIKNIGIPKEAEIFAGPGDVKTIEKERPLESHKGDFGRLFIVGGSETYVGASAMAGLAALRAGIDLVYIASPEKTAYSISTISPNLITYKLKGSHLSIDNLDQLKTLLERSDAILLGPGLNLHEDTIEALSKLIRILDRLNKPTLIDADAIKIIGMENLKINFPAVLTPHSGEFEIIAGSKPSKNLGSRSKEVKSIAKKVNSIIVLKSNIDIISDGYNVRLNHTGNPGMTVGGTGDVLSGIIGCLLAQGNDPFKSAVAGAFINGAIGDFAVEEKSFHIVPTDLIEKIPKVMNNPMSHKCLKEY